MSWTEERVELLTKLWKDGWSASKIAAKLGGFEHTGDGGRSAVLGKVSRLKLPDHKKEASQPLRPGAMRRRGRAPRRFYNLPGEAKPSKKKEAAAGLVPELEAYGSKPLPPELVAALVKKVRPAKLHGPVVSLVRSDAFPPPSNELSVPDLFSLSRLYTETFTPSEEFLATAGE